MKSGGSHFEFLIKPSSRNPKNGLRETSVEEEVKIKLKNNTLELRETCNSYSSHRMQNLLIL